MFNVIRQLIRQPELQADFQPPKLKRKPKIENLLKPKSAKGHEHLMLMALLHADTPLSVKEWCKYAGIQPNDGGHRVSGVRKNLAAGGITLQGCKRTGQNFYQYWLTSADKRKLQEKLG